MTLLLLLLLLLLMMMLMMLMMLMLMMMMMMFMMMLMMMLLLLLLLMMMMMMMKLTTVCWYVCVSCSQLAVRCWIVHSTCVSLETIRNLYATRFEVGTWRHCCVSSTALWKNSSNTILDKKTGSVSWRLHQCDRFSVFVC